MKNSEGMVTIKVVGHTGRRHFLGISSDRAEIAAYAVPEKVRRGQYGEPLAYHVFLGRKHVDTVGCIDCFTFGQDTLAYIGGSAHSREVVYWRRGRYGFDGGYEHHTVGHFEEVPTLVLDQRGQVIFAAKSAAGWHVYTDDTVIGGPYQAVEAYQIRVSQLRQAIYYLAETKTGWRLFCNGEAITEGWAQAYNLRLEEDSDHLTFVTRHGDIWWIHDNHGVSYSHPFPLSHNHYRSGVGIIYLGETRSGVYRFSNGQQLDGPYQKTFDNRFGPHGHWGTLSSPSGAFVYNFLFDEGKACFEPYERIGALIRDQGACYYLATEKSAPRDRLGYPRISFFIDGVKQFEIVGEEPKLTMIGGVPVITSRTAMGDTVVYIDGQRIGTYNHHISRPYWSSDGRLSFYAIASDKIVWVTVDLRK